MWLLATSFASAKIVTNNNNKKTEDFVFVLCSAAFTKHFSIYACCGHSQHDSEHIASWYGVNEPGPSGQRHNPLWLAFVCSNFFFLGSFSLFGGVVVGVHTAHCTSAQNATRLTKMTGAGFTIFIVVHSLACQRWFVARRRGTSTNEATPSRMDNAMWMQFWWRTPRLYGHMGMWECWWLSKLMPVTGWGRLNWGRTVIAWPPFFRDQHFFFRIFLPRPFIGANK